MADVVKDPNTGKWRLADPPSKLEELPPTPGAEHVQIGAVTPLQVSFSEQRFPLDPFETTVLHGRAYPGAASGVLSVNVLDGNDRTVAVMVNDHRMNQLIRWWEAVRAGGWIRDGESAPQTPQTGSEPEPPTPPTADAQCPEPRVIRHGPQEVLRRAVLLVDDDVSASAMRVTLEALGCPLDELTAVYTSGSMLVFLAAAPEDGQEGPIEAWARALEPPATVRPGDEDGRVRIEWRAPLTPPPATVPLAMKEAMRHLRERYGNPASGFSALEGAGLGPQGLRLFRGRSDDGKGTLTADQFHDHHFGGHALVAPSVPDGDSQAEVVARLLARARARQDADPRQKVRLRLVRVARGQWSGCWEGHDPDGGALNVTGSLEDVLRGLLDDPDAPGAER